MTEQKYVVDALLDHLRQMPDHPWHLIRLDKTQTPQQSGRYDFGEVVLPAELRRAVERLNPWLEPDQIELALHQVLHPPVGSLLEVNEHIQRLLREGYPDENRRTKEQLTIRYVDLDQPGENTYIAVEEFKVRIPGTNNHIRPDVVLFVNGLPWVIIECKAPQTHKDEIGEAIDQLMRYSNQRGHDQEGNPALFWYNLCIVATCRTIAKFGTITTSTENYFYRWADPYPFKLDDLPHGTSSPNDQDRLVRGMLYVPNLLNLLQSFSVFTADESSGRTLKVVARYQQFRAVRKTIDKLQNDKTSRRRERGGIIWHTQGSGKSLTMVFLIREMYRYPELMGYKIILLTDRRQLDDQIKETARSIGYTVRDPDNITELKATLRNTNSEVVSVMIHKFQEREAGIPFPELNTSDKILILTDEAHRSQYSLLGANLNKALPNAIQIAFTGTPLEKTKRTFGTYIDYYTMRQAIEDGVTLGVVYEGRTHNAEVEDQKGLDTRFEDVFSDYNIAERLQILGFGTRDAYMEATETIQSKAEDMLRHYTDQVFPNGYKAQVVTSSKESAHRYRLAFERALPALVTELEANNPNGIDIKKLRQLEAKVVLSSGHNDAPYLKTYGSTTDHQQHIKRFRMKFGKEEEGVNGNVGLLIVVDMLLTGFDAPIEQVMYLDKLIRGHNLLQAIARVNRVSGPIKTRGFVVDYVGIGHHLKDALDIYDAEERAEIEELLDRTDELLKELESARNAIRNLFTSQGITDLHDRDAIFDVLYDEKIRSEFAALYQQFTRLLNELFPSKEALNFLVDFQQFTEVNTMAGQHFRDHRLSMKGIPEKLRTITDDYLKSRGVEQRIEPISILDEEFAQQVNHHPRTRTKAAAIEHAIRNHIEINFEEDPALYASLAEALQDILKNFKDNWDEIYRQLQDLIRRFREAESEPTYGLHRRRQMPFFRLFRQQLFEDKELTEDEIPILVALTKETTEEIVREIQLSGFWSSVPAQRKLEAELQKILLSKEFNRLPNIFAKRTKLISRMLEIAKANHEKLTLGD